MLPYLHIKCKLGNDTKQPILTSSNNQHLPTGGEYSMMYASIAASVLLLLFLVPPVRCNDKIKPLYIRGDLNSPNNLKGVYMVEFATSMKDHGKESILDHITSNTLPGHDKRSISFRTKTRTKLFHGHSFRVHGDFDETHLLNIPGAINIYRVSELRTTTKIICLLLRKVI